MSLIDVPHDLLRLVTDDVAREIAKPYTDQVIFPERVLIDRPESADRRFPGWPGAVLVIAVENQGVCAWGVPLDGADSPVVLVGGEIWQRTGWVRGTTEYSPNVAGFVAARRWDASCLSQQPLVQAQAIELEAATLDALRQRFTPIPTTRGWPGHTVHRFEHRDAKIMLWDAPGQCDWWISARDLGSLREVVAALWNQSDLPTSLWSTDREGGVLLAQLRGIDQRP
ncbi:hypothetical protein [Actinoplanes aureus]|uniref:Uncharacterized protein n=1 Tax=Actinoplanes aureus TaxID=2792083 RepID=A0A931G3C7_9ACTN|nr:hypothetical protein [Actinoplanes aureus]MBG0568707.1 hypothetical protein [Actinoplanes aureus]